MLRVMKSVGLVGGVLGLVALVGCGDEVSEHLACSAASECAISTDLSGSQAIPDCCSGFCMVASSGCDSGYRYVRSDKDIGECVVSATCTVPEPEQDMSVPVDLSENTPLDASNSDGDSTDGAI